MKKILTLLLLIIALSALVAGVKASVKSLEDARLVPVAIFAVTAGYTFGFRHTSARWAWSVFILSGLFVIFIEASRLDEVFWKTIQGIPQFQLQSIQSLLKREAPDLSFFRGQFSEIAARASAFFNRLLGGNTQNSTVRETIWDIPILLIASWAGWQTGRRGDVVTVLLPSIALHGFILNYTGASTFSLQIAVFALICLMGVQKIWGLAPQEDRRVNEAQRDTFLAVVTISFALGLVAGLTPVISVRDIARKINGNDSLNTMLGLEAKPVRTSWAAPAGLPLEHLIDPQRIPSESIVFTVKTGELPTSDKRITDEEAPRHYWRLLTYDLYNGQGWSSSPTENLSYRAKQVVFQFNSERYKVVHQQVEKTSKQDDRLYWTGSLMRASQPINVNWRTSPESLPKGVTPILSADMLGALTRKQSYEVDSLVPIVSANQLRNSSQTYPEEIRKRYLTLPESIPQRVLDLASQLTADATNPYDKAKAIEAYLRTYPYSLDVSAPPAGQDAADYFLFDLKTGYCDYYATSMVVLARTVGLPSLLVIGYSSGIYNPLTAEYVVRELNAHSWVEVYFSGVGWVEFEPTANQPAITLPEKLPQEVGTSIVSPTTFGLEVSTEARLGYSIRQDLYLLAALLIFIAALAGVWFLRTQGLLHAHETIGSIYRHVYRHGKRIYKNAPLHETPSVFASNLQEKIDITHRWLVSAPDEINLLTRLYLQEIYSPRPISKDERAHAVKVWRKLFWRLLFARAILAFRGLSPRKNPDYSKTSSHAG
ncbi:MAG: transglutaminase domain-containing protein [Chloroflexi bacterium]|nr:transglutaminase domain-containing protein [Chloroflexota bacterium]